MQVVETLSMVLAAMLDRRELPDMLDRLTMTTPDAPFLEQRTDLVWSILDLYYLRLEAGEAPFWMPQPDLHKFSCMP